MERREVERRYAPELVADPVQRVLNRIHLLPNILVGLALYAWGGWPLVVWGVFLRMVVGLHATWFVNSATHTWGYRMWRTNEDSRNLWWVGLVAWGEGWHNTHHAFPRSARHGFEWWELDATWIVIRALAALGLATDIHLLPENAERYRIRPEPLADPATAATAAT
jgi:stearoyl-CoA desaturase (delta-9 desaturase)